MRRTENETVASLDIGMFRRFAKLTGGKKNYSGRGKENNVEFRAGDASAHREEY